jgi:carbamoyl-phosphate synthase small subunit
MTGFLALEDGTVFRGEAVGAEGFAFGEAVFTTAMTGYQEVVTDPSYAEQIVCFTAPMVGNYGIDPDRCQSRRPHARAVVMREARGPAWTDWLHKRGIVALTGVDTRSLVVHLRDAGAMRAIAVAGEASVEEAVAAVQEQPPMAGRSLAAQVSTPEPYVYSDAGTARIAGVKAHLIDDETQIDERWFDEIETVGLTSGASAPERLVARVCDWFRAQGVSEISAFSSVYEDVVFRLPVELRRAETSAA